MSLLTTFSFLPSFLLCFFLFHSLSVLFSFGFFLSLSHFISLLSLFWKSKRALMSSPLCGRLFIPHIFFFYAVHVVSKESK
jgi:hypothetical protein